MHTIYLGNEAVGTADLEQQGLYWKIRCCCKLTGSVIYKILASNGIREENLGILVPEGDRFCLESRVPIKRIGEENLHFRAAPRHGAHHGRFVAVYPEEPFAYIDKLKHAYLERRGDQLGIILQDES